MPCLEYLIAADRVVLAGLSAYDQVTGRELAKFRELMAKAGHTADEIEPAFAEHAKRIRQGRGRLHRELWTKALAHVASMEPAARLAKHSGD